MDEATLSGQFGASSQGSWSVQLLIEVLEKALALSRVADASRILRRATQQIEEQIVAKEDVDPRQLATLANAAARVSLESADPTWGCWAIQIYRQVRYVPPGEVVDLIAKLVARHPGDMGEPLETLVAHCRTNGAGLGDADAQSIARLEQLRASIADARTRAAPKGGLPWKTPN
jgi:hypothetical protein